MDTRIDETVMGLIDKNLKAAKVLSRHGIDLCSGGNRSLRDACREANISFGKLLRHIRDAEEYRRNAPADVSALEIDKLTRFIERYHHHFTYDNISFIKANLARLVRLYGRKYPELEEIGAVFQEMTAHLTVHMEHEEFIVFPYIRKMVRCGKRVKTAFYRSARSPIISMPRDHEREQGYLRKLHLLTHGYAVPEKGCTFFAVTYAALRELEEDLHAHIRLESEVLFPRALEMESKLNMAPYFGI